MHLVHPSYTYTTWIASMHRRDDSAGMSGTHTVMKENWGETHSISMSTERIKLNCQSMLEKE